MRAARNEKGRQRGGSAVSRPAAHGHDGCRRGLYPRSSALKNLWEKSVCQHRNGDDTNGVTEQEIKITKRVVGKLCYVRRNATLEPALVTGYLRSP